MIEFGCKNCGRFFRVADSNAGKKGKCPDCKSDVMVPSLDMDISFDDNEIEFSNALSFEISLFYDILIQLRESIGLVGTKIYPERNIFFATFQTAPDRLHVASVIQQEMGGIINCITTIGNANQLSKHQLIEILKKFNSEGGDAIQCWCGRGR